jgi:hypothetical protein
VINETVVRPLIANASAHDEYRTIPKGHRFVFLS